MLYSLFNWLVALGAAYQCANITTRLLLRRISPSAPDHSTGDEDFRVWIIIPVFNEFESIAQCALHFMKWADITRVSIVFCGSARERNPTNRTLDVLYDLGLENDPAIRIFEAPFACSSKAMQLNFVLESIDAKDQDAIVVYDVDSRPNDNAVTEILCLRQSIDIAQQHGIFLRNYKNLSSNILLRGQALYQTRWSLSEEWVRFGLYRLGIVPAVHLVGHGLIVRHNLINNYGGFPIETQIEDAHLGFYVSVDDVPIHSLLTLDNSDSPDNVVDLYNQLYTWSKGPRQARDYSKIYARKFGAQRRILRRRIAEIWALMTWLRWSLIGPATSLMLFSVFTGNIYGVAWFIIFLFDNYISWVEIKILRPDLDDNFLGFICFTVAARIFSFAPIAHLALDSLLGISRLPYKTAHR